LVTLEQPRFCVDRNSERHGRDWQRCAFTTKAEEFASLICPGKEGATPAIADIVFLFDVENALLDIMWRSATRCASSAR
jgi:hypothetical protein